MKNYSHWSALLVLVGAAVFGGHTVNAQSFTNYLRGDDVTPSLGQFQLVLDPVWRKLFDLIIPNSPLGTVMSTRHIRLYHNGVFTSPTLYDPATRIGRSDPFLAGGPEATAGTLTGQYPGRTYIKEDQLVVHPTWSPMPTGASEIHTFLKSVHLTDSLTTRFGFSVKAGMLAPTRPVSAGRVEGQNDTSDFPANSFFNVYVVVDLPAGGLLPPIQLVNVDPLLVQQTNLFNFPPRLVYQHENSTAVSLYFNSDVTLTDPSSGATIPVTRGTIFGQLTLAGHGVSFSSSEIEAFQAEIENESETNTMPVIASPLTNVVIQDFAPDYNAMPPAPNLASSHFENDGSFVFTISGLTPHTTNYLQTSDNPLAGNWQNIATVVPTTSSVTFADSLAPNNPQRFYRVVGIP